MLFADVYAFQTAFREHAISTIVFLSLSSIRCKTKIECNNALLERNLSMKVYTEKYCY